MGDLPQGLDRPAHGRAQASTVLPGVRCQAYEAALIRSAARRAGLPITHWMRAALLQAAAVLLTDKES